MSFKTLPEKSQLDFIQARISEHMEIAASSLTIGETITGLIDARAQAGTEDVEIINNDGLVAGLATAVKLLNQYHLESLGELHEMVEEYKA
jgi:hypothetical protein